MAENKTPHKYLAQKATPLKFKKLRHIAHRCGYQIVIKDINEQIVDDQRLANAPIDPTHLQLVALTVYPDDHYFDTNNGQDKPVLAEMDLTTPGDLWIQRPLAPGFAQQLLNFSMTPDHLKFDYYRFDCQVSTHDLISLVMTDFDQVDENGDLLVDQNSFFLLSHLRRQCKATWPQLNNALPTDDRGAIQ